MSIGGALLCAALLVAPLPRASAATMTFTDPSCADFTATPLSNGGVQVTCNFIAVPVCQLNASNLNPTVGTTITLTAACSGSPFGWLFTGTAASCSTFASTCTDTQSAAGAKTYTVFGGNGAGHGPVASVTVNWQPSVPLSAPSGCILGASPSSLPAGGGTVTLTATCTGGGVPTSYSWTGGTIAANTTTNVVSTNIAATTVFGVTPSNGAGNGNTASTTVSVAGTSTTVDFCSTYTNVIVVDLPWGGQLIRNDSVGAFVPNGVLVGRFTVPATATSAPGAKGYATFFEYVDTSYYRQASLSTKACDFRGAALTSTGSYSIDATGTNYPLFWGFGLQPSIWYTINGTASGAAALIPGQTYYYNIRNYSPYANGGNGGTSCSNSTCNGAFTLSTP
jgi:hypothetical protein